MSNVRLLDYRMATVYRCTQGFNNNGENFQSRLRILDRE